MKRVVLTLLIMPLLILSSGCSSSNQEVIKINGDLEETIEVCSKYNDKGIAFPNDKYTLIVDGAVNNSILGRYKIKYSIYTKEGELAKELYRFVNVVDTTAPTYNMLTEKDYYVGFTYYASDFFSYNDNYYKNDQLIVSPESITFTKEEEKNIEFSIEDGSHNIAIIKFNIKPKFDFYKLANSVMYGLGVTQTTAGSLGTYTHLRIDSQKSLSYYESAKSLHYIEQLSTTLASSGSIQISAKFGEFNKANVSFHLNNSGTYSTGFATIDATKETATVTSFTSIINNLNLDVSSMLDECNQYLNGVLNRFHSYMKNTMHLDIY